MRKFILVLIVWSNIASADDCRFESEQARYDVSNASKDAELTFDKSGVSFISVANGIAPARPAFDDIEMTVCVVLETEWETLWVGADSSVCGASSDLITKAFSYAEAFNKRMLNLAATSESYKCADELPAY
ncbi:hypothetical protein A9267_19070 [Shewanella sp. UCD-FRSSP16_17]|uniref:hypothetical protein n=1 Tax=Shewanella sp. UCD-FRSSP16_17 TaxID=1853256 RepID=UPI0007EEE869|nr:hypothetical protein [Shewanella sp. UCD-FRSSP16_17]OBT04031.1 hypothetical protein A9267_19070 [Shewanella sp. UCD-FRSSP16_17]